MPVKWEERLDVKLLSTVIRIIDGQVTGDNWARVAEAMGEEFTPKACRLHFAKIQKDVADGVHAPPTGESVASPASGRKRKAKGESTSKTSPKKSMPPEKQEVNSELTCATGSTYSTD
ncbi:hypothetical protein UA08_00965 [Talaromyces atroroseus]|uniref:Myb-like domain-containing protein n=1 Tax=Talaromyces atroroseus TaxID=1441469 RepID=A0A225AS09_TALAT|nr:hypothetical protein UA08_00965 [Talaromyces atroroseus]OKL63780.1 hypothetical protein UA08_00965 [Talaromyces atroroseus]